MDRKRRKFLKVAGLSALAGIVAPASVNLLTRDAARASSAPPAHGEPHGAMQDAAKPGLQYGMVIDVEKFGQYPELAEKCVTACHRTHNVPDFGNPKDEIKWIWKDGYEHTFPEQSHYHRNAALHELPIMTLCNHCADPPCVRACPTQATFKDSGNGIVMMDFHRCIGCRFCMAACPYGARSFNWRDPRPFIKELNPEYPTRMRGVVEKCNFCAERLTVGLQPACVEATGETGAMVFGNINDPQSAISRVLSETFTIQRKPSLGTQPSVFYII